MFAGIELGGTKCVALLASGPDDVREEVSIPTTTPAQTFAALRDVLEGWLASWQFDALGIASFGPLDLDAASSSFGQIVTTPKPGWSGADLHQLTVPNIPFAIDTDVNGAALAEGQWGAARGLTNWTYITVGTGIGVGSVVGGEPLHGLGHSEAGHMRIPLPPGVARGGCPYHADCVEGLASGPALAHRTGIRGDEIPADHPVWGDVAESLAALCHNLALTTLPQRILIGGGVGARSGLVDRINAALIDSLNGYAHGAAIAAMPAPYVQAPALGGRAGPLGAIALAMRAAATR